MTECLTTVSKSNPKVIAQFTLLNGSRLVVFSSTELDCGLSKENVTPRVLQSEHV